MTAGRITEATQTDRKKQLHNYKTITLFD